MTILQNISNLVKQLIPTAMRGQGMESLEDYIQASAKPLQTLLDIQHDHEAWTAMVLNTTFETISIEHYLNDVFDTDLRRIYLETNEGAPQTWIFQRVEDRDDIMYFQRWKASRNYSAGDWTFYKGRVYEATQASTNLNPADNPSRWSDEGPAEKFYQRIEYQAEFSFTMYLPDTFDTTTVYNAGDTCFHDNKYLKARINGVTGPFVASEWSDITEVVTTELDRFRCGGFDYNVLTY